MVKLASTPPTTEISYYDLQPGQIAVITSWYPGNGHVGRIIQGLPHYCAERGDFAVILGKTTILGDGAKADDTGRSRVRVLTPGELIEIC